MTFIALDWGTSSFRAYLVDKAGGVRDEVSGPDGILSVAEGRFEDVLERMIGAWDVGLPILASGMITSRQGWVELPYVACPAGLPDVARAVHRHVTRSGRVVHFVTGMRYEDDANIPDVMRGEETQVFGSLDGGATHFVAPGTHSKWITVGEARITRFATYMTGEVYAALKAHTILGRLMADDQDDDAAFRQGVRAALADPAGFLHRIFSARSLALFGRLAPASIASYLSGQVIGSEVAHAIAHARRDSVYCVLASAGLGERYRVALTEAGLNVKMGDQRAAVRGLARIGEVAGVIS